jgi:hypothetical protein
MVVDSSEMRAYVDWTRLTLAERERGMNHCPSLKAGER